AEDKAKQMGYRLLLCNSDENIDKESDYINMLISTGVDGVLITPSEDKSKKNLRTLNKHDIPYIKVDRKIEEINCDEIHGYSKEGTIKLLEHLIQLGHKKIAIMNGPLNISTARQRQQAYMDTLIASNLNVDEDFIFQSHYKSKEMNGNITKLLSYPIEKRPTAIFAANNVI